MTNDKSTMKQRLSVIFLCVSTPLALLTALLAFAQPTVADPPAAVILTATINNKIDTALRLEIETAQPGQSFNIIIHMAETADLTTIPANTSTSTRRANLVAQLQQTAAATQAPVIHQLSNLQTNGQIAHYRPFWIINAIAAQGTAEAISALAARSEVAQIRLDEVIQSFAPPDPDERTAPLRGTAVSAGTAILTGPIRSWGIERIRAPHVWNGLGIDGTGVTVGIMDTGVDYLHPDLIENYRGNLGGGTFDHAANWFHAAITTANVPTDTFGHGTHVAGTAVGRNGIGVAPGAQWIAVSIADEYGFIYESSVHAGFEWLLAPDGDPNLAPDVVNNSWSAFGFVTRFITDVTTLHMAGIIPVFAAGNDGPITGTIGSPASYTDTLGIGASDDIDSVAWFSSRGPSPLTAAQKPWIVAPGTHILSSLPGGQYGYFNGTSMATPHVVGTIALLSAAKPDLTRQEIAQILAETAVPISLTQPNNDSGWGRLDAYAAVSQVASTGLLSGTIFGDGDPLPNAALILTTTTGANLVFHTDNEGKYKAALQPGNYTASGQLFGYTAATSGIVIQAALTTTHDIYLASLPEGVIEGVVQDATTNAALTGVTIAVTNTPITVQTDANGRYTLTLPEGQYKLVAMRSGYRVGRATVLPAAGEIIAQDFHLDSAPAILLVDSGQWYFQTQAAYYETALTTLNYGYDKWSIRNPYSDVPTSEDVASYDTVIWSAPSRSPGFIGAEMVVTDYLRMSAIMMVNSISCYGGIVTWQPGFWAKRPLPTPSPAQMILYSMASLCH
jgi:hypothetical protein